MKIATQNAGATTALPGPGLRTPAKGQFSKDKRQGTQRIKEKSTGRLKPL